jgi:hypothetical protein
VDAIFHRYQFIIRNPGAGVLAEEKILPHDIRAIVNWTNHLKRGRLNTEGAKRVPTPVSGLFNSGME